MNKLISLMYHDVYDVSVTESGFQNIGALIYKTSKLTFEDQLKSIARYCDEKLINKENIYLTFDDGGKSFLSIIAPTIEKYGFRGYFFITTRLINSLGFLTTEDIIELDQRGHFIGTHSHSHPKNISALTYTELESEWVESVKILEGILMKSIKHASIPGGFYSNDSLVALKNIGIKVIFTSKPSTSYAIQNGIKVFGRHPITSEMKTKDVMNLLKPYSIIRIKQLTKWRILQFAKRYLGRLYFTIQNIILNRSF